MIRFIAKSCLALRAHSLFSTVFYSLASTLLLHIVLEQIPRFSIPFIQGKQKKLNGILFFFFFFSAHAPCGLPVCMNLFDSEEPLWPGSRK